MQNSDSYKDNISSNNDNSNMKVIQEIMNNNCNRIKVIKVLIMIIIIIVIITILSP